MSKPLLDVIRDLAYEPAEQAAFEAAPAEYMAQHGYEDVPAEDMREAIGLAADTMPANLAVAMTPPGDPDVTDGDLVEMLRRVSTATEVAETTEDESTVDDLVEETGGLTTGFDDDPDDLGLDDLDDADDLSTDTDDGVDLDSAGDFEDADDLDVVDFGAGSSDAGSFDATQEASDHFAVDELDGDAGVDLVFTPQEIPEDALDELAGIDDDASLAEPEIFETPDDVDVIEEPPDIGAF